MKPIGRVKVSFLWPSCSLLSSATGKISSDIFNLNAACGFYYLLPSLNVLSSKCDSKLKDPHFNSQILIYYELTKRELNFLRLSLFNHYLAGLCYRPVAGPRTQCAKFTLECFKIQPVDRICFAIRKNISCTPCALKMNFLKALNRICVNSKYM